MKNIGGMARMHDISRVLNEGGVVRFIHQGGRAILVAADGTLFPLDGRTYNTFLRTRASKLTRTESGSIAGGDLIFEWRRS